MTVYADVLILLNLYVTFFILQFTYRISKITVKFSRLFLAALFGGFSSLYIFLTPLGFIVDCLYRFLVSAIVVLISSGFGSVRSFLRKIGLFFVSSFLYAGAMLGIWAVLDVKGIAINGGIVYMNISPVFLIVSTLICYFIISLIRFFGARQAYRGKRAELTLFYKNERVKITALVDTGHSLSDPITNKPVIIIEDSVAEKLLGFSLKQSLEEYAKLLPGFRMIPYSAVGGHGLLTAFVPEKISLEIPLQKAINITALVAVTNEPLGDDYKAIISPETIENQNLERKEQ